MLHFLIEFEIKTIEIDRVLNSSKKFNTGFNCDRPKKDIAQFRNFTRVS